MRYLLFVSHGTLASGMTQALGMLVLMGLSLGERARL